MVEIPRLPDPPPGRDWPDGDAVGWWWYAHPGLDGLHLLYLRTPSGTIARIGRHTIDADGIVSPSILVQRGDGKGGLVEDWHVGPPSRLLGWGPEDAARYARPNPFE